MIKNIHELIIKKELVPWFSVSWIRDSKRESCQYCSIQSTGVCWIIFHLLLFPPGEGNGKALQYSCLENPMDREAWQATVHGIARVGHDLATKPPPLPPFFPKDRYSGIYFYYYFIWNNLFQIKSRKWFFLPKGTGHNCPSLNMNVRKNCLNEIG